MTARVSPTERIREQIDGLFASEGDLGEVLEQVARLGARLLRQTALEAEVTEHLGRDRYERRSTTAGAMDGSRNGYSPLTIKTTTGPVTLSRRDGRDGRGCGDGPPRAILDAFGVDTTGWNKAKIA